jgi:DNA polymerase-3 subunit alpha
MDELAPHRAILMACLEEAIKTAEQHAQNKHAGMVDLFGGMAGNGQVEQVENVYKDYINTRQWTERHRLHAEKETLGLYLRGHPIDEYERELNQITPLKIATLQTGKKSQIFAGLIVDIRTMRSKRGDTIAFVTLDDRTSRIEVAVFSEAYNAYRDLLMKDTILVVEGEVSTDDYSGAIKARATKMYDIERARIRFAKELLLRLNAANGRHDMDLLRPLLKPYQAEGCRLVVEYTNEFAKGRVHLGENWQVRPNDDLLFGLKEKLGEKCVSLRYK